MDRLPDTRRQRGNERRHGRSNVQEHRRKEADATLKGTSNRMPTHETHRSLTRLARALTSGALALTVLGWGGSALPTSVLRPALADDMDCYNDPDVYDRPECVDRRATDAANGSQPTDGSQ